MIRTVVGVHDLRNCKAEELLLDATVIDTLLAFIHSHANLQRLHQVPLFASPQLLNSIDKHTFPSNLNDEVIFQERAKLVLNTDLATARQGVRKRHLRKQA